ncbi:hypothetical protein CCAX7_62560 [Capsulimonas corticalis]|uniref:Uncharacterized protein n=1 Tax=Capsulimonas corticalis TaxID=2219043 RepID=A0A402CWM1_9BACT|nr:alpha-mannosidase [Capsulimonas corticalis]BDI34205.1 hypothetical protein CCAX7_62560 [Capsulimonas corticalis]
MKTYTFHLIANAHLDPVWLWDAREGLNEGAQTCRTLCDLLDEDPELTFIRGESAIYEHIERTDPALLERIRAFVKAGRWDVVGGTYIQPDTNLPATETLSRHFTRGLNYFQSRFGVRPRVAWAADSFGHSAGLPDILAAAGMEGFAFTRPAEGQFSLAKPAFWWRGPAGGCVLAYRPPAGWYGSEHDELPRRLDEALAAASSGDLENVGVFFGVGNHGGGPTRRQIADIRAWAASHPEARVVFSTLHSLFDALRAEAAAQGEGFLPVHTGELGFCLRGCYATSAKLKFSYRQTEALVSRADATTAAIAAALNQAPADLSEAWDAVLFNSFHDILPGTSIERALDEQLDQLGGARHTARTAEFEALNALARQVDMTVPAAGGDLPTAVPFLIWNPHPFALDGPIELEGCLDYRPLWTYEGRPGEVPLEVLGPDGKPAPYQRIETENQFTPNLPWRARVLVPVTLPPRGWAVYTLGWSEAAEPVPNHGGARASSPGAIASEVYSVEARIGDSHVQILRNGAPMLGAAGLSVETVEDPYGSWGDMGENPESLSLSDVRETWTVTHCRVLESGPERAKLWVRLAGGSSRLDFTFSVSHGRDAVDVAARLLWNERSARLKLVLPARAAEAEFDVPGGSITRGPLGEVPGGRWVRTESLGFASDSLYAFDLKDGTLRATVCRATHYASDATLGADDEPWRPALDCGELRFRFLLTAGKSPLPHLARVLEQPPIVLIAPATPGPWARSGSVSASPSE